MKSEMRWAFAQAYSSIEMIKLGFFLLLTSSLGLVIDVSRVIEIFIGLGLMILIILLFFIRIEKAIKNKFGND